MSDEKKDFVVKDRRIFSGESQEDENKDKEGSAASVSDDETQTSFSAGGPQESEAQAESSSDKSQDETPLPEINFPTFVVSLNASALLHLGAIEDPTTGQTDKNLPMAKQTIDILSMLEEKTAGNLTTEEENLLKNILYDLRIIYVKESG
jgi:hypothetical protein